MYLKLRVMNVESVALAGRSLHAVNATAKLLAKQFGTGAGSGPSMLFLGTNTGSVVQVADVCYIGALWIP